MHAGNRCPLIITNNDYVVLFVQTDATIDDSDDDNSTKTCNTKARDACKAKDVAKTEVIDVDRLPDDEETDYYQ